MYGDTWESLPCLCLAPTPALTLPLFHAHTLCTGPPAHVHWIPLTFKPPSRCFEQISRARPASYSVLLSPMHRMGDMPPSCNQTGAAASSQHRHLSLLCHVQSTAQCPLFQASKCENDCYNLQDAGMACAGYSACVLIQLFAK